MQPQQSVVRQGGKQLQDVTTQTTTTQTTMQPQQADNQTQETQGHKQSQDILTHTMTQGNMQPSDTMMLTNEKGSEDTLASLDLLDTMMFKINSPM